ncbi:Uncharacterised protein [Legionella beliardensis]|uniref:Tetratricopeptide repeat protein n=1 Tax=Legionella beliardensis TaxID=91822 RepID=A0A378I7W0_9GAMM|nr:hypothetical protein [Legionella beliardensis]STX28484.1 Uncharacterised protein [Legionella beliardensis]
MKFSLQYKNKVVITLEIGEFSQAMNIPLLTRSNILTIKFPGKTNWYNSEIGTEIHNKLEEILKQNGVVSKANFAGVPYFKVSEHKGTTNFSSSSQEVVLHMMIAVWKFMQENSNDITLLERDYYNSDYTRLYETNRIDRNQFNDYVNTAFASLTAPRRNLITAYEQYQESILTLQGELNKFKSNLTGISSKYKNTGYLKQITSDFAAQINNVFKDKICLTPLVKHEVAKVISETYQKAVVAHKKNSFFGRIGWSSSDFATDLSKAFKKFLLADGVDSQMIAAVKASNPIEICYHTAEYYFNLVKSKPRELTNFHMQAARYLKLAVDLDNGSHVASFMEKIDRRFIAESAKISEHIALHVIRTPKLRKDLTPYQLGDIIYSTNWSEEKANEVIHIIAGPPPLIDTFSQLERLCGSFSSANLTILTKPSLLELQKVGYTHIGYVLRGAYGALIKNIDSCETVSAELIDFIDIAKESDNAVKEYNSHYTGLYELSEKYATVLKKLEEKALEGHTDFQVLVGQLYRSSNPFTPKNTEKACEFLLMAVFNNEERALQELLEMDAAESDDSIKYSLGKIYLDRLDFDKAFDYFSQVTSASKHYDEAMFECGNIKYCISKDKAEAYSLFAKINPDKKYHLSVLLESCRDRVGSNPSITDIYAVQKRQTIDSVIVSGQEFPKDVRTAQVLFGNSENNKVSLEQLEKVWGEYQKIKKSIFKRKTSSETLAVYNQAKSPIYNDIGRYRILCEYALDKKNQHREFYKLLIKTFGQDFFQERSNNSSLMFQTPLNTFKGKDRDSSQEYRSIPRV